MKGRKGRNQGAVSLERKWAPVTGDRNREIAFQIERGDTYAEVAERFGVSAERVRQIAAKTSIGIDEQ